MNEHDSKKTLGEYGLPVARERLVASEQEARAAAGELGFPVALKAVGDALTPA